MLRVYACITQEHDLRLVLLAGLICLFASYTAFSLLGRAGEATQRSRLAWLVAAAFATGSGVWATHFIAMLAFQPHLPAAYEIGRTILSILIATVIAGFGLAISLGERKPARSLGGAVIGIGIGAMHYVGMSALLVPGRLDYEPGLVLASLVIGIVFGAAATAIGGGRPGIKPRLAAAALLTLGICGLHFTAMAAAVILPDPAIAVPVQAISPDSLAIGITAITILILALTLAGSIVDQHLALRGAHEAARLRASEGRFRQLADATFEGIIIHVRGRIVDANEAMTELVGLRPDQLVGKHLLDICADSAQVKVRRLLEALSTASDDDTQKRTMTEMELRHTDGRSIPVEALGRVLQYEATNARVVAMRDISERKAAEARIRHMAHHDSLTGLPNRSLFHDRLNQALARGNRDASTVAVLCLDLDRFKNVNDLSGHSIGDELLRQVAERLNNSIRADDTVARLSGDEFAVIQVGVSHPDGPAVLGERLLKAINEPFDLDGQQILIGTSIGIALYPGDGENGEALVRAADTALYRAKEAGRGTFRFFEAEMDLRLQARRHLERDLRQALAGNQLEVHYQPLVDCDQVKVLGFEALVRWTHPERGAISPVEFIPLAEECGLIMPLGTWVLRTACREAATWPEDTIVAVNISPAQFRHADLANEVLTILEQTALAPHRLELEITEGVLIEDTERTLDTLNTLKKAGVRISLDDFGTGYSSLSYLHRFPFDKIKIDRSFIWAMEKNPDSMSIVRTVIALGRSLRITVTAEGVETAQQLQLLQSEHCDQAQGFLLGRPLPRREIGKLLAEPTLVLDKLSAAE